MNETFGQRLKKLRKAARLSQAQLAEACGWKSQSRVGNYETDAREPSFADLETIAGVLGISVLQLVVSGEKSGHKVRESGATYQVDRNIEPAPGPVRYYEYPEISWVQAGMPVEAVELSNIATCEMHPSDAWAGEHGFWLKVRGPSMTAQGGISFIEGMVILVAPGFDVEPGNYVVAKLVDTDEATFKQYIWDSGKAYLKPLNPAFPTVEVDDTWVIVGKVVDAKWPRAVLG
ncbi:helix-turn-helix domain-containing protein [Pseudomonas massiliensis]|uniref:helix-turn-helix domain-containing protein n=1 Tax=Pseudomonas massiliensis TaxID=522492 RepID=UPI000590306E|nr:S24 family peptidase [Pseudomonas massiliensis]